MSEKSVEVTSFIVPSVQYKYLRMAMGFTTTSQSFSRAMENLFRIIKNVYCYLNDLLIVTSSIDKHVEHI